MLALLLIAFAQTPTITIATPDPRFNQIQTFRCEFADGEGRDFSVTPPANRRGDVFGEVIFDSVDYRARTARLIGNVGSTTVQMIDGELAVTFIETTLVGGVNVTTIFKAEFEGVPILQVFKAAVSRHIAYSFGAGHTVTQYYGTCRALL